MCYQPIRNLSGSQSARTSLPVNSPEGWRCCRCFWLAKVARIQSGRVCRSKHLNLIMGVLVRSRAAKLPIFCGAGPVSSGRTRHPIPGNPQTPPKTLQQAFCGSDGMCAAALSSRTSLPKFSGLRNAYDQIHILCQSVRVNRLSRHKPATVMIWRAGRFSMRACRVI
jgi:hypothetical protein